MPGLPIREKSCFSLFQVKAVVTSQVRGWDQLPLCSSHTAIIWLVGWVFRTSEPWALCPGQPGHFYPSSYLETHEILGLDWPSKEKPWKSLTLVADQTTTTAPSILRLDCEVQRLPFLLEVLASSPVKSCSPAQAGKEGKLDPRTYKRMEKLPLWVSHSAPSTRQPMCTSPYLPATAYAIPSSWKTFSWTHLQRKQALQKALVLWNSCRLGGGRFSIPNLSLRGISGFKFLKIRISYPLCASPQRQSCLEVQILDPWVWEVPGSWGQADFLTKNSRARSGILLPSPNPIHIFQYRQ